MADPVLFLDVDGVLNHEAVYRDRKRRHAPLCPDCLSRLDRLVKESGCRIVLSSAWRGLASLETKLRKAGVFRRAHRDRRTVHLIGDAYKGRGSEIAEWLKRHPEVTNYVIVDDESDMLPEQLPRFVQTNFATGLLDEHVEQICALFATEPTEGSAS